MGDKIAELREKYDADLVIYAGKIARPYDDQLIDQIGKKKKRKNVLLWLVTYGGDPTAAYRIARRFQSEYEDFIVYVNSACFSAGTLLALGADRILMDCHGELGPIDIQLPRQDEVGEMVSGLASRNAIRLLADQGIELFDAHFRHLRLRMGLSTRLAAQTAAELASGALATQYQQIDPMRLAEDHRYLQIVDDYANRIRSKNVKEGAIRHLINFYSSHDFSIDLKEAEQRIFEKVERPCAVILEIQKELKARLAEFLNLPTPAVIFLEEPSILDDSTPTDLGNDDASEEIGDANDETGQAPDDSSSTAEGGGSDPSQQDADGGLHGRNSAKAADPV